MSIEALWSQITRNVMIMIFLVNFNEFKLQNMSCSLIDWVVINLSRRVNESIILILNGLENCIRWQLEIMANINKIQICKIFNEIIR